MNNVVVTKKDEIVIKLLHYFIIEEGYNPIILHGAENEIWLENLKSDYKIVRIVSNYIHNNEQLDFDAYRTKRVIRSIRKKTFMHNVNTISIFVNLGDNVKLDNATYSNIYCADLKSMKDISKYRFIIDAFPTITTKTLFTEKGLELFNKLTAEINSYSEEEVKKNEEVFKESKPIVTYLLILVNTIIFLAMYIIGSGSRDAQTLIDFGANVPILIKMGEYYRLITSAFLHIGVVHFLFNNYALYVIGPQLENFFGKIKFLIIYLFSALTGNLLSLLFTTGISAGASGAIFGLLGALLYFGYHYRVYLGSVIRSQIIPLIVINLLIGFTTSGINNAAHIGGMIGGILIAMALGVKYKSSKEEKINGVIMTTIFTGFLIYMSFFR